MVDERTEEEQIEAVKAWWKRNGTSLLVGIGLAVALVIGWQGWQSYQTEQRMAAAARFQELVSALNAPSSGDEERRASTVTYAAETLRTEHGDKAYAVLGSLLEAKYLMDQQKAGEAVDKLEWALDHAGDAPLPLVVRERLARAQFIAGEQEQALETLQAAGDVGAFTPLYKELEGDILKAQGDIEGARAAYKVAEESATGGANPILQYKMADMAIPGDA